MPTISVTPAVALVDTPVAITLAGFAPGEDVTLRARTRDDDGREWASFATFRADGAGAVDLTSQPPLAGSYAAADAMGPFWSMTPPAETPGRSPFAKTGLESHHHPLWRRGSGPRSRRRDRRAAVRCA